MAEVGKSGKEIKDFQGLILDSDLHDLPNGSTNLQINCTSDDIGVLRSRKGYVLVLFENEGPFAEPVNYKPEPPAKYDPPTVVVPPPPPVTSPIPDPPYVPYPIVPPQDPWIWGDAEMDDEARSYPYAYLGRGRRWWESRYGE